MELIEHNKSGFSKYKYDNFIEDTRLTVDNDNLLQLPTIECNKNDDIAELSDDEDHESGEDEEKNLVQRKLRKEKMDKRTEKAKQRLQQYKSSKF